MERALIGITSIVQRVNRKRTQVLDRQVKFGKNSDVSSYVIEMYTLIAS